MKFPTFSSLLCILFLCLLAFTTEGARHIKPKKVPCCHNTPNHVLRSLRGRNQKVGPFHTFCKGKASPLCKRIPGALPQI
ncbi:protein GPR15L [Dromiciops gliroides]|uniref:protein GPR15L n=1 Tax=Dromiciops gliroides TaxID=33562 RepID=UPI001CC37334|nr:protein GPR15L [Dromiciops gliroides]